MNWWLRWRQGAHKRSTGPRKGNLPHANSCPTLRASSKSTEGDSAMKLPFELQGDEQVLLLLRRHWLYFSLKMAVVVLTWLLPTVAIVWLVKVTAGLDGTVGKVTWGAVAVWFAYSAIRAYFTWYRYQNDLWVVTTQRLIDSTKFHWFKQRMASADLVDVEDINVVREGIFPTFFNFGDVRCQTAGEVPNFILSGIPKPTNVLAVVDSSRDAARRSLARPLP